MSKIKEIKERFYLWIDKKYEQKLNERQAKALYALLERFIKSYEKHKDSLELNEWLFMKMREELSEFSDDEVRKMSEEIIQALKITESKQQELENAMQNGVSVSSWLGNELEHYGDIYAKQNANQPIEVIEADVVETSDSTKPLKDATSFAGMGENTRYLSDIDTAIKTANDEMQSIITTQSGTISQNPNLDGFIAEQHHANTFNINAKAKGSEYRAEVLSSTDKNSVDIVIKDGDGNIVRRYQSKYGATSEATGELFDKGDYRGQQKLVPEEQAADLQNKGRKVTDRLEAPDGTTSESLSKQGAKDLQTKAQEGKWDDIHDWDNVSTTDAAKGIARNAMAAGVMGCGIGAGATILQRVIKGEKIQPSEVVEQALKSGADSGVKVATAGALKVAGEKGILPFLKGASAATCANIAFVAIENAKVLADLARGRFDFPTAVDKMGQVTASTIGGIAAASEGAIIGASLGTVLGPVGSAVGGFIGSAVGFMAGSAVGKHVYEGAKAIRKGVASVASGVVKAGVEVVKGVGSAIGSVVGGIAGAIGSLF